MTLGGLVGIVALLCGSVALVADTAPAMTLYLALGDSVAAGHGASRPEQSYVGRELARLRRLNPSGQVRLVSLAGGGATSEGVRRWQAPAAAAELAAVRAGHRPGLRAGRITITAGGNDLLGLFGPAVLRGRSPDPAEVQAAIERVERNLNAALETLVAAGGAETRITLTTYYNPFAGLPPDSPSSRAARATTSALNAAIARAAARFPTTVRVARVDQALPADEAIVDYLADEIHPNDRGHAAIAAAVASASCQLPVASCQ